MGGYGSGGHNRHHKGFIDHIRHLDSVSMQNAGVLALGHRGRWTWTSSDGEANFINIATGEDNLHLDYKCSENDSPWKSIQETIELRWSARHLGGAQVYFACPECLRTCRYLYGAGLRFLCRRCHKLTYRTSAAGNSYRTILGAQRLRKQIGASGRLWSELPERPRYMRRSKYDRIVKRIVARERIALRDMIRVAKTLGIDVGEGES